MKAARITKYGGPDVVTLAEAERPEPKRGQVLITVRASSINPFDIAMREGRMKDVYKVPLPFTLGVDVAGVIAAAGTDPAGFAVGDEVFGSASVTAGGTGAFAEAVVVPVGAIARKPRTIGFVESAAAALTGSSAVQAIEDHLKLARGQRILIHGGAGGIGTCAIQLAKRIGAHVTTTASGEGIAYVRQLGVDEVIDYKACDFAASGAKYDAVLDTIGGDTYNKSFTVLARGGRIVSMLHPVDAALADRHGVTAQFLLTRMTTHELERLRRHLEEGVIKIHVERALPLDRLHDAFVMKERGRVRGKIALSVGH